MNDCRQYWVNMLTKLAAPVLINFKTRTLHKNLVLVIETKAQGREQYMGLEILGRTLSGLAPWLETPAIDTEEERLRLKYADLAREAIDAATDKTSPDYCIFSTGEKLWNVQWLVDAAYLSLAIIRAPKELCEKLPEHVRKNLADCLRLTRNSRAVYNNWILFSAIVEAALYVMGEDYDIMRVDYAIRQMEQWYSGDGFYQDGSRFELDYYNSYVMQPMLTVLVKMFHDRYVEKHSLYSADEPVGDMMYRLVMNRFKRYARIQEMSVSPDGSYPPFGRSIVYRCGAFHALAQASLWDILPDEVSPAMARVALTIVIKKSLEARDTFNAEGWLNIGVCGHQPSICENYISTSSLYMASLVFLPLGLDENKPFWSMPDEPTTWEKVFSGEGCHGDHALGKDISLY